MYLSHAERSLRQDRRIHGGLSDQTLLGLPSHNSEGLSDKTPIRPDTWKVSDVNQRRRHIYDSKNAEVRLNKTIIRCKLKSNLTQFKITYFHTKSFYSDVYKHIFHVIEKIFGIEIFS